MKALITGGAGFIGSYLTEGLVDAGHKVTILDSIPKSKAKNLSHLQGNRSLKYIKGSILDRRTLERLIPKVDFIFHFAAAVGVKRIIEKSLDSLKVNVLGSQMILEIAAKHGKKVMIASTSEIYGKTTKIPFKENDDRVVGATTNPRWAYSDAKAINEFFALAYHREKGLKVIIVRPFNVTGPRQVGSYGMVLPRFVEAALKNKPLNIYGDGGQTRCFCHVKDAVRAFLMLTRSKSAYGEIFNVGNPRSVTIRGLAQKIIKISGSRSKIKFIPRKKVYKGIFEDIRDRKPSIVKIKKYIGYSPKYDLSDIIRDMIRSRGHEAKR